MTARQHRRTRKKQFKAAKRAVAAFETAAAQAVPVDQYQALLDGLAERGAPADLIDEAVWLVDLARKWDVEIAPSVAATAEMAPTLGRDVDGMVDDAARIRRNIAEGLLYVSRWQPEAA